MPDWEKVITAMYCCMAGGECDHCPYARDNKQGYEGCYQMHADALALLKQQAQDLTDIHADLQESIADNLRLQELVNAQEPVKPVLDIDTWKCGKCGHTLEHQELLGDNVLFHEQYNYCPECGRPVKWDG